MTYYDIDYKYRGPIIIMTILYKVTDQNYKTFNDTQWGPNVSHGPTSGKGDLCSSGWLHAYKSAKDAALMYRNHVDFKTPILWQAEGIIEKQGYDLKIGTRTLKTVRIIPFPEITPEDIDSYLDDKDWDVRVAAIKHSNVSSQNIDKALNDKDFYVRAIAIEHPNVAKEHIDKALDDQEYEVRYWAIKHPNASIQHIDKALDNQVYKVRYWAVKHPNATKEHIDKALNDEDYEVRKAAILITQSYNNKG